MTRLAIITPWFGAALHGGAERQSREVARRLAARGHAVEVLTTCCRSFADDWATNYHAPGIEAEEGYPVHRFPVDPRHPSAFDRANAKLLSVPHEELRPGVSPADAESAREFVEHNINSAALISHLEATRGEFDAFLFIPYLYGTTLKGLHAVAERALLQPCLHDEAYARLPVVAELFRRARLILFNSEGERELARRLYGPGIHTRSFVVGEGVEFEGVCEKTSQGELGGANRAASPLAALRDAPFVLYLGRRDATKNTDLLVRAFRRFKQDFPCSGLKLVLAGPGSDSFDAPSAGIHDLGVVDEETKRALLSSARALFQPSRNESFSRAMMEAWRAGRPVAAHRDCLATAHAVLAARGGWLAATDDEWTQLFSLVNAAPKDELNELGARGRAYAAEHADWDRVLDRYEAAFATLYASSSFAPSRSPAQEHTLPLQSSRARVVSLRAVHQLLPDFVSGDAISNQALALRAEVRAAGYESEIFAKRREVAVAHEARLLGQSEIEPGAGLIYHHSIGSEVTGTAAGHRGPCCLVYHNVTPHEFFAPYRPGFAWLLETGRAGLSRLARHFPCSAGVSAFNVAELSRCGFRTPGVLPNIVNPDRWNVEADEELMQRLQDGQTNVLFVGRVAPNKRQDALVRIFAEYLKLDPVARLIIAGDGQRFDPYFRRMLALVEELGLAERVTVTGRIADGALLAYYRTAHLYLSASEHEGFGVPLVEAMWFDVPVLARAGTAVAETVCDAGVFFGADASASEVARLAYDLARGDEGLRRRLVAAGRRRREDFTPRAVRPALEELLRRMEETYARRAQVA